MDNFYTESAEFERAYLKMWASMVKVKVRWWHSNQTIKENILSAKKYEICN